MPTGPVSVLSPIRTARSTKHSISTVAITGTQIRSYEKPAPSELAVVMLPGPNTRAAVMKAGPSTPPNRLRVLTRPEFIPNPCPVVGFPTS